MKTIECNKCYRDGDDYYLVTCIYPNNKNDAIHFEYNIDDGLILFDNCGEVDSENIREISDDEFRICLKAALRSAENII